MNKRIKDLVVVLLFVLSACIASIPFIRNYPFLPGPDTPFYLFQLKRIAAGTFLYAHPTAPPLFIYFPEFLYSLLNNSYEFLVFAVSLTLLSGINTIAVFGIAKNLFGWKVGIISGLISVMLYAKYRIAWDLYNNYYSLTLLLFGLYVYTSSITTKAKSILGSIFTSSVFFSHPATSTLVFSAHLLFLLASVLLRKLYNIKLLALVVMSTSIIGFLVASPFTFQFFFGMNDVGYSAGTFLSNNNPLSTNDNELISFLTLLKQLPFQKGAFLVFIQKWCLTLASIGAFAYAYEVYKKNNKSFFHESHLLFIAYFVSIISIAQTEIVGLHLLQDRFAMMSYPFFSVLAGYATLKGITLIKVYIGKIFKINIFAKYVSFLLILSVLTMFVHKYVVRAINYNSMNLGTSIDAQLDLAIKTLGSQMNLKEDVVISNNLYRYWMLATYPEMNISFGDYYAISGAKWYREPGTPLHLLDEGEQNASILSTNKAYALNSQESYDLMKNRYHDKNSNIYLFMRRNELPGYTDWEKFEYDKNNFEKIYDKDDYIIYKAKLNEK